MVEAGRRRPSRRLLHFSTTWSMQARSPARLARWETSDSVASAAPVRRPRRPPRRDRRRLRAVLNHPRHLGEGADRAVELDRLARALLDDDSRPPDWAVYCPGLFQGAAGIGYELLHLADPERVPSVLLFP